MSLHLHIHLSLVFFEILYFNFSTASCNEDQRKICLQAVSEKRLNWLSTGGECISKQYVQYTHLCTVFNYFPSVDYCCCHLTTNLMSSVSRKTKRSFADVGVDRNISKTFSMDLDRFNDSNEKERIMRKMGRKGKFEEDEDYVQEGVKENYENAALCCRYHQNWENFRCLESEDALIPSPVPATQRLLNRFKSSDFYVGGLVIAGFVFLSLGVVCVLKMWKYKRMRIQDEKEWMEKDTIKKIDMKSEIVKETMKKKKEVKSLSPSKESPSKQPDSINIQYRQQPSSTASKDDCKYGNLNTFFDEANKNTPAGVASEQASLSNFTPKFFLPVRGSTTSDYFSYFDYSNANTHNLFSDSLENESFSSYRNDTSDCSSYSSGETSEEPERHPYYSFYRRRVLGLDARQPPCAANAVSSFGGSNGMNRHFRRHSRHIVHFRHHQLKRQRHLSYCAPPSTFLEHSAS